MEKTPFIEIRGLRKVYKLGKERVVALDDINLTIQRGEICCILGTSGSGKSTLLNIVFQSYNLMTGLSGIENVAMPLMFRGMDKDKRTRIAKEMLREVGLGNRMKHKPTQMSGGQQQRVGIARAFVTKPKIVFADEPTGNLDSKTTTEVMELMVNKSRENNQTFILVTHDNGIARYADRIVTIVDGKIVRDEKNESIARTREQIAADNARENRQQAEPEEAKVSAPIPAEKDAVNMSTEGAE